MNLRLNPGGTQGLRNYCKHIILHETVLEICQHSYLCPVLQNIYPLQSDVKYQEDNAEPRKTSVVWCVVVER